MCSYGYLPIFNIFTAKQKAESNIIYVFYFPIYKYLRS